MEKNSAQLSFIDEPVKVREIDRVLGEHFADNINANTQTGEYARKLRDSGIMPGHPSFPDWRTLFNTDDVFAGICGWPVEKYKKWKDDKEKKKLSTAKRFRR